MENGESGGKERDEGKEGEREEETANEDHVMGDYGRLLTDEMKG